MELIFENYDNKEFKCVLCKYVTNKSNHWKRHLISNKHIKRVTPTTDDDYEYIECDKCEETFFSRTSYWRHINFNKCIKENVKRYNNNNYSNNININDILKNNQEFMIEQNQQTLEFIKEIIKTNQIQNEKIIMDLVDKKSNITKANRITNNSININVTNNMIFQLNEKFPDALTMNDFLHNIKYSLGDLTKMSNKPAFIDQVTSLFCDKIFELETKERPLHFIQDNGQNSFYIKENGEWEQKTRDDMDKQLKNTAHCISKIRNEQWEEKLNSGTCTEKDQDNWTRYVKHVTTEITDIDIDRNLNKLKKSVQLNKKELLN